VTEKKVLGNKLVFRGNGNLHVLCRCAGGQLQSWDLEIPFSQFAELEDTYGNDAQGDLVLSPTTLELELGEDGRLRFKGGAAAQYLITDRQLLPVTEDAYSPGREVQLRQETIRVPAILESRRENLYGEQTLAADAQQIVESSFQPDFPRQRFGENGMEAELSGQFQVLYYAPDGTLRSGTARWEGRLQLPADENTQFLFAPGPAETPRAVSGGGQITLRSEIPMEMTAVTEQSIPMLTGIELGEPRTPDPDRPSLILRRAGEDRLWDIAKASGSTMAAIRRLNGITEEPAPDRMLIIPVS
jgi:hypothetical protein